MFTDIVGSTALRDALILIYGEPEGDRRYREQVLGLHNSKIRSLLEEHLGFEVKTNGDSFMATFSVHDAVRCAVAIQRSFESDPVLTERGPLSVRIGLHSGKPTPFRVAANGITTATP